MLNRATLTIPLILIGQIFFLSTKMIGGFGTLFKLLGQ